MIAAEPLKVRVTWWTKLGGHLFWVILLPLFGLKENRRWKALWVLLPYVAWLGIAAGIGATGWPGDVLMPLPTVLGGLMLLGGRFEKGHGGLVLLAAIGIAVLVHGVWVVSGAAQTAGFSIIGSSVLFGVALVAMLLARWGCRGRYRPVRLSLLLLLATLLVMLLAAIGVPACFAMAGGEKVWEAMRSVVTEMLVPVAVAGLVIFGLLLSFLGVAFSTEFYRRRLSSLLKLKRDVRPGTEPPPMPVAHS